MCCFILHNSVLCYVKTLVLICASLNYKRVLFITALILAADKMMPLKLKTRMRWNFWKIQFLFYSGICDAHSISALPRQKSKETITQDNLLFTIEVLWVLLYNGNTKGLFKRSSNALMWLSNEVETKRQSFRHYSRDQMIKMKKYCTTVNPNPVR